MKIQTFISFNFHRRLFRLKNIFWIVIFYYKTLIKKEDDFKIINYSVFTRSNNKEGEFVPFHASYQRKVESHELTIYTPNELSTFYKPEGITINYIGKKKLIHW